MADMVASSSRWYVTNDVTPSAASVPAADPGPAALSDGGVWQGPS
jgi:hypothetical protein